MSSVDAETEHRLWLSDSFYIRVDDTGRCIGECYEGALGFIIQLDSLSSANYHFALKIPRLMGETHRENAYITELTDKEFRAVKHVFQNTTSNLDGLLYAAGLDGSVLQRRLNTDIGDPKAEEWNGALIFVSFEKGKNPRFCLVKKNDTNQIETYPRTIIDGPVVTAEVWQEILNGARDPQTNKGLAKAVFVDFGIGAFTRDSLPTTPTVLPIYKALGSEAIGRTWYACLPSIQYAWALGTLQQSISRAFGRTGSRGKWSIADHLTLVKRVCSAVNVLHSLGMLHADIRPANIMYRDSPENPEHYWLSDYGSFAEPVGYESGTESTVGIGYDYSPTGDTVMGPVISGERASVFYAPERRSGQERESANTAVIYNPKGGSLLYIVLGWRDDLVDAQTGQPRDDITMLLQNMSARKTSIPEPTTESKARLLQKHDRIQVREYIFQLEEPEIATEDRQILICRKPYWKIYHNRIVVMIPDEFEEVYWVPIPRTVELLQWSAATDLYSIGALALYSMYRGHNSRPDENAPRADGDDSSKHTIEGEHSGQDVRGIAIEEDFREMLKYLTSPPYFNTVWPDLEWLTMKLEESLGKSTLDANGLANEEFKRPDGTQGQEKTLKDEVVRFTRLATQVVPGMWHLVAAFGYDLGAFVLYLHFALYCLHRRSDLTMKPEWKPWMKRGPFCNDRNDLPGPLGPAKAALDRIRQIQDLVNDKRLIGLRSEDIPRYNPEPDVRIRIENEKLKEQLRQTESDNQQAKEQLRQTESDNQQANAALETERAENKRLHETMQQLMDEQKELNAQLIALKKMINDALTEAYAEGLNVWGKVTRIKQKLLNEDSIKQEQFDDPANTP